MGEQNAGTSERKRIIYLGGKDSYRLIDTNRILGSFLKSKHHAIIKYADYVSEKELDIMIMDVEDDSFVKNGQSIDYTFDMAQAKERLSRLKEY